MVRRPRHQHTEQGSTALGHQAELPGGGAPLLGSPWLLQKWDNKTYQMSSGVLTQSFEF